MPGKAVISLTTRLEDPEKVTVAFLVAAAKNLGQAALIDPLSSSAPRRCGRGSATRPPPPSATDPGDPVPVGDVRSGTRVSRVTTSHRREH
jgi:hypothetical protein